MVKIGKALSAEVLLSGGLFASMHASAAAGGSLPA